MEQLQSQPTSQRAFAEGDKRDMQQELEVIKQGIDKQLEHRSKIEGDVANIIARIANYRGEMGEYFQRKAQSYQNQIAKPLIITASKGKEASPYGYVLEDWKLTIQREWPTTIKKECPGRQFFQTKNPLIGFSVGIIELLKDQYEQLSEAFDRVTIDSLEWIRGIKLISELPFLEPRQIKELLDDFLYTIRSAPVPQIYQEYDIIDQVVVLGLRGLIVQCEPSLKELALSPSLTEADYEKILHALANIFTVEVLSQDGRTSFKLYDKSFGVTATEPCEVDMPL